MRWSGVLVTVTAVAVGLGGSRDAAGTCSPPPSGDPRTTADYVHVIPDPSLSAIPSGSLNSALSAWQGCTSAPSHPGFPYPTTAPIVGAPYINLTVVYHSGFKPTDNTACGQFPGMEGGNYLDVFQVAFRPGTTETVSCGSYSYTQIIEHELGHFYGLGDIYDAGCQDIMAQLDGMPHYVGSNDCTMADQQRDPLDQNNPIDYSCSQACYTTCVAGSCPAYNGGSPILVDLGDGFRLSGTDDAVVFDLLNNGRPVRTSWTQSSARVAFLALDLNANGNIDNGGELFGNHTELPDGSIADNGYAALAQYDAPELGGNGDGRIDIADAVYLSLRLWTDLDHNGKVDFGELSSLPDSGIAALSLGYKRQERRDRFGNRFVLRGEAVRMDGRKATTYDAYFVLGP